jgi:DNA-binding NarL/FixJ family response regulator
MTDVQRLATRNPQAASAPREAWIAALHGSRAMDASSEIGRADFGGCEAAAPEIRPRVALIDGRPLLRENIASLLRNHSPSFLVVTGASADEIDFAAISLAVIWTDCREDDGLRAARIQQIRHCAPIPIIAFTDCDDPEFVRGMTSNGVNLIDCRAATAAIILASINLALAGGVFAPSDLVRRLVDGVATGPDNSALTPREIDVIRLLTRGLQNKTIAFELGVSVCTIKVHVQNVMKKLKAKNRTEVAFLARPIR